MQGVVPMMLEIVAVGAMASTLELRMPCLAIFSRSGFQSILPARGTSTSSPRSSASRSRVSCGMQAAVPLGTFVGAVGAVLGGDVAGGFVGVVGDGFHELVVEVDGGLGGEGDVLLDRGRFAGP